MRSWEVQGSRDVCVWHLTRSLKCTYANRAARSRSCTACSAWTLPGSTMAISSPLINGHQRFWEFLLRHRENIIPYENDPPLVKKVREGPVLNEVASATIRHRADERQIPGPPRQKRPVPDFRGVVRCQGSRSACAVREGKGTREPTGANP